MFCRCVPLLGGKHMYVCLKEKKNWFNAALFGHLKFYFIYWNTFSYLLNRRFFFLRTVKIIAWCMKNVCIFFLFECRRSNCRDSITDKVNLSTLELFEKMANKQWNTSDYNVFFFLLFTHSNLSFLVQRSMYTFYMWFLLSYAIAW